MVGGHPTGLEAVAWAQEVERLGAGEIVLTSMDCDGTKDGLRFGDHGGSQPGGYRFRSWPAVGRAVRSIWRMRS